MNLATYSPGLVVLFVAALFWILMDVRFSKLSSAQKIWVPAVILALAVLNHGLRAWLGPVQFGKYLLFTMHLPFYVLFLHLTKCGKTKMFFMILCGLIFTSPISIITRLLTGYLEIHTPWVVLLSNLVVYGLMLLIARVVFRKIFIVLLKYGENRLFWQFSLVPLSYYFYVFAIANVDFSMAEGFGGMVVRYFPTLQAFLFLFLLMSNYKALMDKHEIESARLALSRELAAAETQLSTLNKAQMQYAVYLHDLRHHLSAIDGYLAAGLPQQASAYIQQIQESTAAAPSRFCKNELVNLLCSSFHEQAKRLDVNLQVEAGVPETLQITDTELCSILSNGLENAIQAAAQVEPDQRWVKFYCILKQNKLLIEIKNPYTGEILLEDGLPVSPQPGHGYGCRSINAITERYHGLCTYETDQNRLTLRVVIPFV